MEGENYKEDILLLPVLFYTIDHPARIVETK